MGRGDFRFHSVTALFRRESLKRILAEAIRPRQESGFDKEFARFHAQTLMQHIPPIRIDYFSSSFVETNAQGHPSDIRCALWNLPDTILANYEDVLEHDIMAPAVYGNPGRLIAHDDIIAEPDWQAHPFFLLHCRKYGIHCAWMINLRLPGKQLSHVTFEYLAGPDNKTFGATDRMMVELASLPFAYAWFFRFGAIDRPVLTTAFDLLADLTSTNLTLLRKFVSSPHLDLASQARDLGLSPASYKQSLYQLRDELAPRIGASEGTTEKVSLRQIDHAYSILKLLGDPTEQHSPHK